MKSVRLNEALMGRLGTPEKLSVAAQSTPVVQSFRSSWPGNSSPKESGAEQVSTTIGVNDSTAIGEEPAPVATHEAAAAPTIGAVPMMIAATPAVRAMPVVIAMPVAGEPAMTSAAPATGMDAATKTPHEHVTVASTAGAVPKAKHQADAKPEISSVAQGSEISTPVVVPIVAVGLNPIAKADGGSGQPATVSMVPGTVKVAPAAPTVAAVDTTPQPSPLTNEQLDPVATREPARRSTEIKGKVAAHEAGALKFDDVLGSAAHVGAVEVLTAFPSPHPALNSSSPLRPGAQLDLSNGPAGSVNSPAPQTIVSTPSRLDVGILNGTHGWLQVRAELGAGGAVNTSVTAIDAAHESLRSAVPEIASYLSVEAVKVNSIEVHRFAETPGTPNGMGAESRQQGGGQGDGAQRQPQDVVPILANSSPEDTSLEVGKSAGQATNGMVGDGASEANLVSLSSSLAWRSGGVIGSGAWLSVLA